MYGFEAIYSNMDTFEERTERIEFDGQSFPDERECYLYAMRVAYDKTHDDECFVTLNFIYC